MDLNVFMEVVSDRRGVRMCIAIRKPNITLVKYEGTQITYHLTDCLKLTHLGLNHGRVDL